MLFKVLLVVAGVSALVTARPTEENTAEEPGLPTLVLEDTPLQLTQNGEGELEVGQNGEVNLQLAELLDPTESPPPPSVLVPRRRFSGYGRKKRESTDDDTTEADEEELLVNPDQTDDQPPRRDFGDLTRLLNIAGAKPQVVDPSGGYSGRRRRSSDDDFEEEVVEVVDPAAEDEAEPPRRDFGDLARLLSIAGAKPQAVDLSGSYSGRRRRSDNNLYGLVPEVDLDAVKIKPHGKNGQQVQNSATGIPVGRAIFEPTFSRVKRADFIPFNEYDQRRIKTLKIEQNDFLALPKRLEQEEEQADRQKRKFQEEK